MEEEKIQQEAIRNFDEAWELIDKQNRSKEEDLLALGKAYASLLNWKSAGGPTEEARGEWLISRIYSLLNMGEAAVIHGLNSVNICNLHDIGDFDLAFAYEAVTRGYGIIGDIKEKGKYYAMACEAAENIESSEDKDYFLSEFKTA